MKTETFQNPIIPGFYPYPILDYMHQVTARKVQARRISIGLNIL